MADVPDHLTGADIPEAVNDTRKSRWAPLVWAVPVVAVGVGAWIAVQSLLNLGTAIQITFKSGEGLEAGATRIKYKDVDIGTVKSIELTPERDVLVKAEIRAKAKDLIVEDSRFWIVRPRITGGQALGLGTLLSGPHIAMDPGKSPAHRSVFEGLENPPPITTDVPGRSFVLRAADLGSVDVGSPVYFRRVRVGKTISTELDPSGKGVVVRVFVNSPYDRYVTTATRFWDVSGLEVSIDSNGLRLETESLVAILIGGVAFEEPPDARKTGQAAADAAFVLHPNRDTAMKEIYSTKDSYMLHFTHSVRGLSVGSPVDFLGVQVGEVTSIKLDYDRAQGAIHPAVEINVYPERLSARLRDRGPAYEPGRQAQTLQRFVDRGLRAQLRTGNFLTGQVYISLDFFPKEARIKIDASKTPLEIPTMPGGFEELQAAVTNVAKKLEKVPFDELATDFRKSVASLDATLHDVSALVARVNNEVTPEVRATLEEARATLAKAQGMLADDAPLQGDLSTTLRDVSRASQAVRSLADYLERHPESLLRGKREDAQ
ncbi:MAG TPA: MlaD family protein [Burkholderiales bacterium]|nr:MlaD family protein [Burkholderiales bacterium]